MLKHTIPCSQANAYAWIIYDCIPIGIALFFEYFIDFEHNRSKKHRI